MGEATPQVQAALQRAVEKGHVGDFWLLLTRSDVEEGLNNTMLARAAWLGHERVVGLLLARSDIDADKKDESGCTALSKAADAGQVAVVRQLLKSGKVEVDSADQKGRTPLSWATGRGHVTAMRLLIERDANLESKDELGRTPLSHAVEGGYDAAVQLLMEKGADVETEDGLGLTPLDYAWSEQVVIMLVNRHLSVAGESSGSYERLLGTWLFAFEVAVALVLKKDIDPQINGQQGTTLLSWAAGSGLTAVVRLLLQKGANLNARDGLKQTPLM